MSFSGILPSGVPDLSLVKDFTDEKDARIINNDGPETKATIEMDSLPTDYQKMERKLQDIRKMPLNGHGKKEETEDSEEEPIEVLYLLRLPKPDYESEEHDRLQQDFETQLNLVKKYSESRRVKILEKTKAKQDTNKALDCLKEVNKRINEKKEVLKPYRDQSAETRKARNALMDSKRHLPVSTERQLDQMIRDLTFRLEHETISLAEEKEIPKQLRQLEANRPKVRELEAKNAEFNEQMSNRDLSPTDKELLEKELKEYKSEQEMYQKMFDELKTIERDLNKEIDKIAADYDSAVRKKDLLYGKLTTSRENRKKAKNEWTKNREFSNEVRDLVKEGKIEEAQRLCNEQVKHYMELLQSNEEYRKEYLRLWENKRINPMAIFDVKPPQKSSSGKKQKQTLHENVKVLPGQSLEDAIVASVMKDAEKSFKKASTKKPKTAEKKALPKVEKLVEPETSVVHKEEKEAPVPTSVHGKSKKAAVDTEFKLPAVVLESAKAKEVMEKETIEAEQPQNKQDESNDEASAKKQKQQQEARKEKEAEKRKKRAEAAKRKKEREESEVKERQEAKAKETQEKAAAQQNTKKSSKIPKMTSENDRTHDVKNSARSRQGPRPVIRKNKKPFQMLQEIWSDYPIIMCTILALSILLIGAIYVSITY